ncbi:hypothetical protein ES703_58104 [subsurface metagenome]
MIAVVEKKVASHLKFNSPAAVAAGESYVVRLTVLNQSTRAGEPVGATLGVGISAATKLTTLIPAQVSSEYFAPNETRTFDFNMPVPAGTGGETGLISAWVDDPTGKAIASATEDVVIVEIYPIDFTGAAIYSITVQANVGWWGTNYYSVVQMGIAWNAAHRVPEVEGSGSGSIRVDWQLHKGGMAKQSSYTTTPQTREPAPPHLYYFAPGAGSVGWPYAGMLIQWGGTMPPLGTYDYVVNLKAMCDGELVGEATFTGTVRVSQ